MERKTPHEEGRFEVKSVASHRTMYSQLGGIRELGFNQTRVAVGLGVDASAKNTTKFVAILVEHVEYIHATHT